VFAEGKMIAAGFNCDLHYYLKYVKGEADDKLFKELGAMDLSKVGKNSAIVSIRGTVHKDWHNKGIGKRLNYEKSLRFVNNGYIKEFSWVVSPYTLKMYKNIGTTIWKDVSFELNGQTIK
jgi:hypothetical protein